MLRVIINLDPNSKDTKDYLERTIRCVRHYTEELKKDGRRITATWDSGQSIVVYHDNQKEPCIYSPHVKEEKNDWFKTK